MNKDTVIRFRKKDEVVDPLVELLRSGAHELISRAVEEELQVFLEQQAGRREATGRLAVVRNGYQPERALLRACILVDRDHVHILEGMPASARQ